MLIFSNYKLAIMEQTVKERLITFLKAKRLGQTKFEKLCGLSNGYINNLRHCPSAAKLAQILEAFPDLNRAWLLTGEGEMLTTTPAAPEKQPSSEGVLRPAAVPHTVPLVPHTPPRGRSQASTTSASSPPPARRFIRLTPPPR